MTRRLRYYPLFTVLASFLLALGGCSDKHTLNERFTLWRDDKIPYGTWYAYNNLSYIFPEASVKIEKRSPDRSKGFSLKDARNYLDDGYSDKKTTYIIIAPAVLPDEGEMTGLFNMIGRGDNIFISALMISDKLLDTLHLKTSTDRGFFDIGDSLTVDVEDPLGKAAPSSFTYPGQSFDNYFVGMDSSVTHILGRNGQGHPDFIKISYESGGALYIHLAPEAFTNFFLLHKQNKAYYDEVFSYLPHHTRLVRWDEYFRYHAYGNGNNSNSFSALGWMSKQPALSWLMGLSLLLLLFIYLFESKRRQRLIPEIAAPKNASLDFVRTIGRLYYQRRDNRNLSSKMVAHFQDYVRSRYNIRTSVMDEAFVQRLAYKSGYDPEAIGALVYDMKTQQDMPEVSDEDLLALNQQLEKFYKNS